MGKKLQIITLDEQVPSSSKTTKRNAVPESSPVIPGRGWRVGSIEVPILVEGSKIPFDDAPRVKINNIVYRPILDVIKEALSSPQSFRYIFIGIRKYLRNHTS